MRIVLLVLFAGISLSGCKQQIVREKRYLNMDSLVTAQVNYLSLSKASLKKDAAIGDKKNASTKLLDSTAWSHELDVFRQLDLINRPIYKDVYLMKDGLKDSKSNLLIRSYEAIKMKTKRSWLSFGLDKKTADPLVPYVRLYYQDLPSRLKRLEALYQENNSLYGSKRKLEMYFDDSTGKTYLKGYLIEGDQKMILSDSVHYIIRSEVVY